MAGWADYCTRAGASIGCMYTAQIQWVKGCLSFTDNKLCYRATNAGFLEDVGLKVPVESVLAPDGHQRSGGARGKLRWWAAAISSTGVE